MTSLSRFDVPALRAGASVALVFAVPFSIAARIVADRSDDGGGGNGAAVLLSLCAVAGFVLGAGVAAWVQRRQLPLSHGIVTAVATYTVAQAAFVLVRLAMGDDVHWFAVAFNLSVSFGAGLLGGFLGQALRRRGVVPMRERSGAGS